MDAPANTLVQSLVVCPKCGSEMWLRGIEPESSKRDLFTFECSRCEQLEVRGVRVTPP
jgi:hypothetical protein